jgi:hypothetical protein
MVLGGFENGKNMVNSPVSPCKKRDAMSLILSVKGAPFPAPAQVGREAGRLRNTWVSETRWLTGPAARRGAMGFRMGKIRKGSRA